MRRNDWQMADLFGGAVPGHTCGGWRVGRCSLGIQL